MFRAFTEFGFDFTELKGPLRDSKDSEEIDSAEAAALNATPKVYKLKHSLQDADSHDLIDKFLEKEYEDIEKHATGKIPQDTLRFFVFGCQGNAKEAQRKVAELLYIIAKDPSKKPDFILILGDNFYDFGIRSPDSPAFKTHFYEMYKKLFDELNIPFFVILGNHDENLHKLNKTRPWRESGVSVGLHQVAASYLKDAIYTSTESKIALYNTKSKDDDGTFELDLDTLPAWNMPSRAFSLLKDNTQLFCMDSNTLVKDNLAFKAAPQSVDDSNQLPWLIREVRKAKAKGRKTILALHHPPFTTGKRAYHSDLALYLTDEEIKAVQEAYGLDENQIQTFSYNELVRRTLKEYDLEFDLTVTAHDHDMYYYNNNAAEDADYYSRQITAGGGGGGLHKHLFFKNPEYIGLFLDEYGFTSVTSDSQNPAIHFAIHSIDRDYGIEFTNSSPQAVRHYPSEISSSEQDEIQRYCDTVKRALHRYFKFIDKEQSLANGGFFRRNISHGYNGVKRAHEILAYISRPLADDFATTCATIEKMSGWKSKFFDITLPTDHSFITLLFKEITLEYGDSQRLLIKPPVSNNEPIVSSFSALFRFN